MNLASDSVLAPVVKVKRGDPAKILFFKEGEYHFYNINIGYAGAEFPFAKPFSVEASRINYVGDFMYESVGPAMLEYPFVSIFE
jgi:hypothetical protein